MKTTMKLAILFPLVALLLSLITAGYLMARPIDSPSSAVEAVPVLKGGTQIGGVRWYSIDSGFDVIVIEVNDRDKNIAHKHPNAWRILRAGNRTDYRAPADNIPVRFDTATDLDIRELQEGDAVMINTLLGITSIRGGDFKTTGGTIQETPFAGFLTPDVLCAADTVPCASGNGGANAVAGGDIVPLRNNCDRILDPIPSISNFAAFNTFEGTNALPGATRLRIDFSSTAGPGTADSIVIITGKLVNSKFEPVTGDGVTTIKDATHPKKLAKLKDVVPFQMTYNLGVGDIANFLTTADGVPHYWAAVTRVEYESTGDSGTLRIRETNSIVFKYEFDKSDKIKDATVVTSSVAPESLKLDLVEEAASTSTSGNDGFGVTTPTSGVFRAYVRLTDEAGLNGKTGDAAFTVGGIIFPQGTEQTFLFVSDGSTITVSFCDNDPAKCFTLEALVGRPFGVQDLRVVDPVFGNTVNTRSPKIRWNPPLALPDPGDLESGGIKTYEVAITGDPAVAPAFQVPFTPLTGDGFFTAECFTGAGGLIGTGGACVKAIATTDQIQITVHADVPDGTHLLAVRLVDKGDNRGLAEKLTFSVDATPPPAPLLKGPATGDQVPDSTPEFVWTQVADPNGLTYTLEIGTGDQPETGDFRAPVVRIALIPDQAVSSGNEQVIKFAIDKDDSLALGEYRWHVQAVDGAGNIGGFSASNIFRVTNTSPVADDQSVGTKKDTPVSIRLTGSDADAGDTFSFILVSLPGSGDLSEGVTKIISGDYTLSGDTLTYTPHSGSTGSDRFSFKVNDGLTDSNIATVTIHVGLGLADSPWPKFRHDATNTGRSPYTRAQVARLKWSFDTGTFAESSPAVGVDGTIYLGTGRFEPKLYAINPDGTPKWPSPVAGGASSPAIAADGTIYVADIFGTLYAANRDGTLKWSFSVTSRESFLFRDVSTSLAIGADGTIYLGYDQVYAISPVGTLKWSFPIPGGTARSSSPAIRADGTIYVASQEGNLYALNPDGTLKWSFATGKSVQSSPAVGADGTIYLSTGFREPKLYAINPDGTPKWRSPVAGSGSSPAIGADGTIYVGSTRDDPHLYALNPDGTLKWSFPTGSQVSSSPAIGSGGTIFVGSDDNNIYAINSDGTLRWKFLTRGAVRSSPAIGADGTIYVFSHDNKLYAIAEEGSSPPSAADMSVATEENTPVTVTLVATDFEDCELNFSIPSSTTNALLWAITQEACAPGSPNTDSVTLTYLPDIGFTGTDRFTYSAIDAEGLLSQLTTVTVTVGQPLQAVQGNVKLQARSDHSGVRVTFSGQNAVFTDAMGGFQVQVPPGTYAASFEKDGFLTVTRTVLVVDTNVSLAAVTLLGGDNDGNGTIDVNDLVIPAKNLGETGDATPAP